MSNTIAYLSGSTVSQFPAHVPQLSWVPNSYLTSYSRLPLGSSHLALPFSEPPCTDLPASSHSRQQGAFGECLLFVRIPWISPSASCAVAVPLVSTWFWIEAVQTAIPEAKVGCHFPFHSDMSLQNSSATSLVMSVLSQQMGKSRMTEIPNKGRMFLTLRKQSFPSPPDQLF